MTEISQRKKTGAAALSLKQVVGMWWTATGSSAGSRL